MLFSERWLSPACRQAGAEINMHFVYFLQSKKDGKLYIGKTNDIDRRLQEHNSGNVQSTKPRRPFKLLDFEQYDSELEARRAEIEWKKGCKREIPKEKFNL